MNMVVLLGLVVAALVVWALVVLLMPHHDPKPKRRIATPLQNDPWRVTQLRRGKADS